jgi:HD-GYP domain-containing protein (c-di-GMP phosphodiesterase class II)
MTALPDYRHEELRDLAEKVIARLPESAFGNTEWVTMTARAGADHLRNAIASNRPHRVANAIRSMAHAPCLDDVETLAQTICDTIVSDGYATRNTETIAQVKMARHSIAAAISELRDLAEPASAELSLLREAVNGYVRLAALYDPAVAERLDAVGALAARLARAMKLPATDVLEIEFAGRLHDIGMIGIPRSTREKTIGISKKDVDRIKHHPVAGASLLADMPSLAKLAPIVRAHHERFDGRGYPDGLHGDEIPLASRVISVAAAFVHLCTESDHIEPMLPNDACRELAVRAGTEFDPNVVTAALHLLNFRQRIRSA